MKVTFTAKVCLLCEERNEVIIHTNMTQVHNTIKNRLTECHKLYNLCYLKPDAMSNCILHSMVVYSILRLTGIVFSWIHGKINHITT